uniref:Uncharacterized protein n=1 Tax=Anguilla anguilla TaxID=7936 RepID=A0A0E9UPE4_ANGAN
MTPLSHKKCSLRAPQRLAVVFYKISCCVLHRSR